jgi:predicted phage tail protein
VIHTVLQVLGVAVMSAGFWMLAPWLGAVVAGVALVALGVSLEADRRRNAREPV